MSEDEAKDRDERSGKFLPGNKASTRRNSEVQEDLSGLVEKKLSQVLSDKGSSSSATIQALKAAISFQHLQLKKKPNVILEPFVGLVVAALQRLNEKLPVPTDVNMVLDSLNQAIDEFEPEVPSIPALPLSSSVEGAKPVPPPVVNIPGAKAQKDEAERLEMAAWVKELEASQKK